MKFLGLVWGGIWRRPIRTALALISAINAFLLLGLLQGFTAAQSDMVARARPDLLLTANRVSQASPLPISLASKIASVPGVTAVARVVPFNGTVGAQTKPIRAFAVQPEELRAIDPLLKIRGDQYATLGRVKDGALIASTIAQQYGWKVGDRIPFRSQFWMNRDGTPIWSLEIVGIYQGDERNIPFGSSVLVNYSYVDEARTAGRGTTGLYFINVGDPQIAGRVAASIDSLFANSPYETKTATARQLAQALTAQLGDVAFAIRSITSAVFFALLFSVGAIMFQSVRERSRELGVLKAIGFTNTALLLLVLSEVGAFCFFSAAVGLTLAWLVSPLVQRFLGFNISVGPAMVVGLISALGLAFASGLPPALRAMRLNPVGALTDK
jgi:putative ABC transport system permease protein